MVSPSPLRIGSWRKGREVFISSDDYIKIKVKDHDKGGEHNNDDLQHLVSDVTLNQIFHIMIKI